MQNDLKVNAEQPRDSTAYLFARFLWNPKVGDMVSLKGQSEAYVIQSLTPDGLIGLGADKFYNSWEVQYQPATRDYQFILDAMGYPVQQDGSTFYMRVPVEGNPHPTGSRLIQSESIEDLLSRLIDLRLIDSIVNERVNSLVLKYRNARPTHTVQ